MVGMLCYAISCLFANVLQFILIQPVELDGPANFRLFATKLRNTENSEYTTIHYTHCTCSELAKIIVRKTQIPITKSGHVSLHTRILYETNTKSFT